MFWTILFILAVAAEFVTVPLFLKYSWPKKCWKSFGVKMICSALFFLAGLLAVKISGNHTPYAHLIPHLLYPCVPACHPRHLSAVRLFPLV